MNDVHESSISQWLLRLFAWDGLLPLFILSVPTILNALFPINDLLIAVTAVSLPIVAFWIRYLIGMTYIRQNYCGPIVKFFQKLVFSLSIMFLVLIDFLLIALQQIPNAPGAGMDPQIFTVIAIPYSIYLCAMAFALYPGFRDPAETGSEYGLRQSVRLNEFGGEEYV